MHFARAAAVGLTLIAGAGLSAQDAPTKPAAPVLATSKQGGEAKAADIVLSLLHAPPKDVACNAADGGGCVAGGAAHLRSRRRVHQRQ